MGCDIHMYVEAKIVKYPEKEKRWVNIDRWEVTESFGPDRLYVEELKLSFGVVPVCDDRDYQLFTILAGVREDGQCVPIAPPRGLPADAAAITKIMEQNLEGYAHSQSYLTLSELKASIYCKETPMKGWVHEEDIKLIKDGLADSLYYLNTNGEDTVFMEWSDKPNVAFLWIIDRLEQMKAERQVSDDDIRIVFWFDS